LGYTEDQRVSVVRHDIDNVHVHVAINKIHPQKLTCTSHAPITKSSRNSAPYSHELNDAVYASVDDISQVARLLG
jgi:hypothetical protein